MKTTTPKNNVTLNDPEVHFNTASEQDEDNSAGNEGASYSHPNPTLKGKVMTLQGIVWYDRNVNGSRDLNEEVDRYGGNVEFSHGVAGVHVELRACNETTGE